MVVVAAVEEEKVLKDQVPLPVDTLYRQMRMAQYRSLAPAWTGEQKTEFMNTGVSLHQVYPPVSVVKLMDLAVDLLLRGRKRPYPIARGNAVGEWLFPYLSKVRENIQSLKGRSWQQTHVLWCTFLHKRLADRFPSYDSVWQSVQAEHPPEHERLVLAHERGPEQVSWSWRDLHESILLFTMFHNECPQWSLFAEQDPDDPSNSIPSPSYIVELQRALVAAREKVIQTYNLKDPQAFRKSHPLEWEDDSLAGGRGEGGGANLPPPPALHDRLTQHRKQLCLALKRALNKNSPLGPYMLWRQVPSLTVLEESLFHQTGPLGLVDLATVVPEQKDAEYLKRLFLAEWPWFVNFEAPVPHILVLPTGIANPVFKYELWVWYFSSETEQFVLHRHLFNWDPAVCRYSSHRYSKDSSSPEKTYFKQIEADKLYDFLFEILPSSCHASFHPTRDGKPQFVFLS